MFAIIVGAAFTAPALAEPEPVKKELFAKEDWYKSEKGKEQDFVGILRYTPRAKGVVGFGRFNPFKLEFITGKGFREVYVGGKDDILKEYNGIKVKITGKPVDMEVEGRNHKEIWPARIEALPNEKPNAKPRIEPRGALEDPDIKPAAVAPAPKDGEVKVPTIIAKSTTRLAVKGGEATQAVYRSAEELAKSMPINDAAKASESAAQSLKVKEIDWKTQMIIVVSAGTKRSGGYSVEVTGLELNKDKELVVKWKLNSPAPNSPVTLALTHPAQTILVDRFEGKVVFDPAPPKPDVKLPDIKRPEFKRPVDRIPPGTLPVVPEKPDPNKPIKICGEVEEVAQKDEKPSAPKVIATAPGSIGGLVRESTIESVGSAEALSRLMRGIDAEKASAAAATRFKVDKIDWSNQMIVIIAGSRKPTGGYSIVIDNLEVKDGELVVKYTVKAPPADAFVTQAFTTPAISVLIDKFDGKIKAEGNDSGKTVPKRGIDDLKKR